MPIIKFASAVFGSSRKTGISIAFLTGGVLLLFAVQNISDPRPRAMRSPGWHYSKNNDPQGVNHAHRNIDVHYAFGLCRDTHHPELQPGVLDAGDGTCRTGLLRHAITHGLRRLCGNAGYAQPIRVGIQPTRWQSKPVQIIEQSAPSPDTGSVDLRTNDNRRVVVSVHPKIDILLFDRRTKVSKRSKKRAADRIADFAVRPVLDGSRYGWGVTTIEVAMSKTDEFFDMEADAVGKKLNVDWKTPTRLYFHVVD